MLRSVVCVAIGDHVDVHYSFWVCMDVCVTVGSHVEVHDSCYCWLLWAVMGSEAFGLMLLRTTGYQLRIKDTEGNNLYLPLTHTKGNDLDGRH